jgi:hypothetical protein
VILIKFAFWVVIAVILCCFTCACTNTPAQNSSAPGPTIIDKTPRDGPEKAPFEAAWIDLSWYNSSGTLNLTNMTIHQIHGSTIDAGGNASSWILGIQQENVSSLLVYENEEWRQVAWGEPFTSPVIEVGSILLPTELYEHNHPEIEEAMTANKANESELDLSGEAYTISIRSSTGISLLRFNATTGESLS